MPKGKELSGMRFGSLTVEGKADHKSKYGETLWLCLCDCGNRVEETATMLTHGKVKSCGKCKRTLTPHLIRTHKNRLYHAWSEMKRRCKGASTNSKYYSDKGISYCADWEDYDAFANWAIANGYEAGLEIDRIDGDKGYCPSNCRWVTHKQNSRNRKARANNTTGVAGVQARVNRTGTISFRAVIATDGGKINLGTYKTVEEAAKARKDAERKHWGFAIGEKGGD